MRTLALILTVAFSSCAFSASASFEYEPPRSPTKVDPLTCRAIEKPSPPAEAKPLAQPED